MNWIPVSTRLPPNGEVVETKIEFLVGGSIFQDLMYFTPIWKNPDGSIYFYLAPTHWRKKQKQ